jgi:periplasmic divalent cation tolerance protein
VLVPDGLCPGNREPREVFMNIIQIVTTMGDKDEAEKIGRYLVEKRLASCAQIVGPIKSIYRWKGKVEEAEEWQCIIKSRKSYYRKIEEEIRRLHSYELPEITASEFDQALKEYADWIIKETDVDQS